MTSRFVKIVTAKITTSCAVEIPDFGGVTGYPIVAVSLLTPSMMGPLTGLLTGPLTGLLTGPLSGPVVVHSLFSMDNI